MSVSVWVACHGFSWEGFERVIGVYARRQSAVAAVEAAYEAENDDDEPPLAPLRWEGDMGLGEGAIHWYLVKEYEVVES